MPKPKKKTTHTDTEARKPGAQPGNQNALGNPGGGRPTDYDPEFHPAAAKKLCELGATDRDLAEAFDISLSTLWAWKSRRVEFTESIKVGKDAADERVVRGLYLRAVGYDHPAVKIMQYEGCPIEHPYVEHVPPDVTAAKFWLVNRRKDEWSDKQKLDHDVDPASPLAKLAEQLAGTAIRPKED